MTMGFNAAGQIDNSFQKFEQQLGAADDAGKKIALGIVLVLVVCLAAKTELQLTLMQRIIWRLVLLCAVLHSTPYMTGGLLALWVSGPGDAARRERSKSCAQPPPKICDWLLCIFLSKEQRDNILGDTEEDFPKWVKRYGVKEARSRYYREVFSAARPGIVKFLYKIGAASWIIELTRRWFL